MFFQNIFFKFLSLFFTQTPETPQWLLSKNRTKQAEKSLRWLRGWVPAETVAHDFQELQRHSERSKSCNACIKQNLQCSHPPPSLSEKFSELKRKRVLKPFAILLAMFFLTQFTGMLSTRPFIIQIFKAYESPIEPDYAATLLSIADNLGNLTFILLVRFTGKRNLYMTMGAGIFFSSLIISIYGFIYLPSGYISFDLQKQSFELDDKQLAYIPMVCHQ